MEMSWDIGHWFVCCRMPVVASLSHPRKSLFTFRVDVKRATKSTGEDHLFFFRVGSVGEIFSFSLSLSNFTRTKVWMVCQFFPPLPEYWKTTVLLLLLLLLLPSSSSWKTVTLLLCQCDLVVDYTVDRFSLLDAKGDPAITTWNVFMIFFSFSPLLFAFLSWFPRGCNLLDQCTYLILHWRSSYCYRQASHSFYAPKRPWKTIAKKCFNPENLVPVVRVFCVGKRKNRATSGMCSRR